MYKKEVLELSILRAEGYPHNPNELGCYVSINGDMIDVISPLNSHHDELITDIPVSGNLELVVKHMKDNERYLGSVQLPLNILPKDGFQWVPLYKDPAQNKITALPTDIVAPKVLVLVNSLRELSPVPEITERSEDESQYFEEAKESQIEVVGDTASQLLKCRLCLKDQINKTRQAYSQYEGSQKRLAHADKMNNSLKNQISSMAAEYEKLMHKSRSRENELLSLLNEKETQLGACLQENASLRNVNSELDSENYYLKQKLQWLEEHDLSKQVKALKYSKQNSTLDQTLSKKSFNSVLALHNENIPDDTWQQIQLQKFLVKNSNQQWIVQSVIRLGTKTTISQGFFNAVILSANHALLKPAKILS